MFSNLTPSGTKVLCRYIRNDACVGGFMKSIYIAAPFRGPDGFIVYQNVVRTEQLMYELIKGALEQQTPVAVLCPHSMTVHFDRTFNDVYWLEATLEHMRRCDAILLVEGWAKSEGAKGEREEALAKGLPVFYGLPEALAWLRDQVPSEPQSGGSVQCLCPCKG